MTFTVIIAVHQFGHYFTARLLGMKVLEFAFGFPPRIAAITHAGIAYSLNAIPFGGFVRILGQDDFAIHQEGEGEPGSFTSKPWWAQAIVLVGRDDEHGPRAHRADHRLRDGNGPPRR